jgi:hypothetical protein
MIHRHIMGVVQDRLTAYPAVALVGPRQCGKTTFALALQGDESAYFDLEQEGDRVRLDLAWDERVQGEGLTILDEAQAWPDVFPRLRGAIDRDRARRGRFLLLGSVAPSLMVDVSESLAGRLSLVELTSFLRGEVDAEVPLERHWLCGGFPYGGILEPGAFPRWQHDYLALLVQRDLPAWGLPARPQVADRLMRMVAALHGQTWNASQVGQGLGVTYHTVNGYLDYLAGAYLVRRLQPYRANLRKRLVKSPRVYWRDSGLLHALLRVTDYRSLLGQPWVGASWEGFVIEQALGSFDVAGRRVDPYYFRTSDGYEVDLVLALEGGELWAVEVKLTSNRTPDDLARLDRCAEMIGASRRYIVSQVSEVAGDERRASLNLAAFLDQIGAAG